MNQCLVFSYGQHGKSINSINVTKNLAFRWIDSGTEDRKLEIDLLPLAEVQIPLEPEEDEDEDKIETSTWNSSIHSDSIFLCNYLKLNRISHGIEIVLGGVWQCTIKMAQNLPDPPPEADDKENDDPRSKDSKSKGRSKSDRQDEEYKEESGEKKEDENALKRGEMSLIVYCEKGVAGPFVMKVNEEHQFSLGATEVFDDVVGVRVRSHRAIATSYLLVAWYLM